MKVAVLALQGAFAEHEQMLSRLNADFFEIRQKQDLEREFDALILPGGESTVQGKLLRELDIFDGLRRKIASGLPVMATCAGLILLAEKLSNDPEVHFGTLNVTVRRNAYGRQLGSFLATGNFGSFSDVPMPFIRAPYIESAGKGVEILARHDGYITAVRQGNQLAMSFHPELTQDTRIFRYFLEMATASTNHS